MSYFPSVAFLTDSAGTGEWIVLFVVILIVIGPKKLPDVARKIGRTMEMFRRAADEFKDQLMNMDQEPPSSAPAVPLATATASADVDGVTSPTDPSSAEAASDAYATGSDYPGNEGQVENWHPEAQSDQSAAVASVPPADQPKEGGA